MPDKELESLINQLHEILENTEQLEPETLNMVTELEADIQRLLDAEDDSSDYESIQKSARSLEARFAVEHPVAERFLREIVDVLAKVGI